MPTIRIPNLNQLIEDAQITRSIFILSTRLPPIDADRLGCGEALTVADPTLARIADALGVEESSLVVGGATRAPAANDSASESYDDAGPGYEGDAIMTDAAPPQARAVAQEYFGDGDPTPPFERALERAEGFGDAARVSGWWHETRYGPEHHARPTPDLLRAARRPRRGHGSHPRDRPPAPHPHSHCGRAPRVGPTVAAMVGVAPRARRPRAPARSPSRRHSRASRPRHRDHARTTRGVTMTTLS